MVFYAIPRNPSHPHELLRKASSGFFELNSEKPTFIPDHSKESLKPISVLTATYAVIGSAAFAGGGGGSKEYGSLLVDQAQKLANSDTLCYSVSIDDVEEDEVITPFAFMGKPTSITKNPQMLPPLANTAYNAWVKHNKRNMKYVCPVEVGPTNSIPPIFVATASNVSGKECYVVDCDLQGRAVLSLTMLGPYIYGADMRGTCYAYISSDGEPLGEWLCKDYFDDVDGVRRIIYGAALPDDVVTPSDVERFLSGINQRAHIDGCLGIAFGGLQKTQLMAPTDSSCIQEENKDLPVFTPNTLSRSIRMGERVYNGVSDIHDLLHEENGVLICEGRITKLVKPTGGSRRSDAAYVNVEIDDGRNMIGVFNNETVFFGDFDEKTKVFTPLVTSPNTITLQVKKEWKVGRVEIARGECLTNDEIEGYFTEENMPAIPISIFALPPPPLLITQQALNHVGPNCWGLAENLQEVISSGITNVQYIPSSTTYKDP